MVVVVLVLTLIAALGWIFYQNFTNNVPTVSEPQQKTLKIPEWGIEGVYTEEVTLTYTMEAFEKRLEKQPALTSKEINDVDGPCSTLIVDTLQRHSQDMSYQDMMFRSNNPHYKKVGSYYYYLREFNHYCTADRNQLKVNEVVARTASASRQFFESLRSIK